jgi:hypothetical protein
MSKQRVVPEGDQAHYDQLVARNQVFRSKLVRTYAAFVEEAASY